MLTEETSAFHFLPLFPLLLSKLKFTTLPILHTVAAMPRIVSFPSVCVSVCLSGN